MRLSPEQIEIVIDDSLPPNTIVWHPPCTEWQSIMDRERIGLPKFVKRYCCAMVITPKGPLYPTIPI